MEPNKDTQTDFFDELFAPEIKEFADALGLQTSQARLALEIVCENLKLFDRKQKDYGSGNIANNPMPEIGVAIRANDKVQRIMNLLGKEESHCEAREDSWMDLANYGLIGYMVAKGLWK